MIYFYKNCQTVFKAVKKLAPALPDADLPTNMNFDIKVGWYDLSLLQQQKAAVTRMLKSKFDRS